MRIVKNQAGSLHHNQTNRVLIVIVTAILEFFSFIGHMGTISAQTTPSQVTSQEVTPLRCPLDIITPRTWQSLVRHNRPNTILFSFPRIIHPKDKHTLKNWQASLRDCSTMKPHSMRISRRSWTSYASRSSRRQTGRWNSTAGMTGTSEMHSVSTPFIKRRAMGA